MTSPDVPLRMELRFELPGTPQQLWDAIATGSGISAWFLPTDLDPREGGTIVTHMGEDASSSGTVTDYDAPRRFAYEEPNWAELTGHADAVVSPLATEFLVEAQSGGTCVVRVVTSAFGVGADWEREFFADMERMWGPFFDNLRLYLTHFPGQRVTSLSANATVPGSGDAVRAAMRQAIGASAVGEPVEIRGLTGKVQRLGDIELLVRVTDPVDGFVMFSTFDTGDGKTWTQVEGYLFSDNAADYVKREQPAWKAWLEGLAVAAT